MKRFKLCDFLVGKMGLLKIVENISYSQSTPMLILEPVRSIRVGLNALIKDEVSYGTGVALKLRAKSLRKKVGDFFGLNPFCATENKLINVDSNYINILPHLSYLVKSKIPVVVDSAYFDLNGRAALFDLCSYHGDAEIVTIEISDLNNEDYFNESENTVNGVFERGGIVLINNAKHVSVGCDSYNKFMDKSVINRLGKGKEMYFVLDVHTALDYSTLDFLVRNRKSLNLNFIAQTTSYNLELKVKDGWVQDYGKFNSIMSKLS